MTNVVADFRYTLRVLRRQPAFVAIAVLTLTLGIGANTAIFRVVKVVLLNPLPCQDPEEIVVLWESNPEDTLGQVSIPTYLDWKSEASTIATMAAYRHADFSYKGTGDPRTVPGVRATPELFDMLRATARVGRTFVTDEAIWGATDLVVLSHGFWERTLVGRPGLVGTTIELNTLPFTVVSRKPLVSRRHRREPHAALRRQLDQATEPVPTPACVPNRLPW